MIAATIRQYVSSVNLKNMDWGTLLPACIILLIAAAIRLSLINDFSFTVDESTMIAFAQGVMERGYPFIMVGTMEVPLATYELVPYPIALSMSLFGLNEFAVRLPSVLFAMGTAGLIYYAAYRWFDRYTAILATLLYALSPWAIYWGHNSFHPAQAQFFAMLTLIRARTLLNDPTPSPKDYYLAALFFVLTFLSWEGSGFMLPVIFIAGLLVNFGTWQWLQQRHLWYAIGIISVVVVMQGIRRVLLQVSYLMIGSGKSETSLPQLMFTKNDYNPWFYIINFFGQESNIVLTAVFVAGLFLLKNNRDLRFIYAIVFGAVFFLTNFLSFASAHYVYWALPFFEIGVAAVTIRFCDKLNMGQLKQALSVRVNTWLIVISLIGLELATATPYGLKLYDLVDRWQDPQRYDLRIGLAGTDYKNLSLILKREYQPGDVVVTLAGMPMEIYSGLKGQFFLQGVTAQKVIYDPGSASPYYVDKYVGSPVLRGREELENLCYRNDRVWLFIAPTRVFLKLQDPDLVDFIDTRMKVVAESYDATLYLWSR